MMKKLQRHADLADFLERLLRNQMEDRWEIDDFESTVLAFNERDERWPLELWRRCAIDVAGVKRPLSAGHWMHPDARLHMKAIIDILRYIEQNKSAG